MLYVSAYDTIIEPTRTIIITIQAIFVICSILMGVTMYFLLKKKDPTMKKSYFFGMPIFLIFLGINRLILIYHDFYATDDLDLLLWGIACIIHLTGFVFLNYTIETYIYKKTKHTFTISGLILLGLFIFFLMIDKNIATIFLYIGTILQILAPLGIFLIVARQAVGIVKKKAYIIVLGILIMMITNSIAILKFFGVIDKDMPVNFSPLITLLGLIVFSSGFLINEK